MDPQTQAPDLQSATGRTPPAQMTGPSIIEALQGMQGPNPMLAGASGVLNTLGGGQPGYAVYPTKDGFVALAALEPRFLARLKEALAIPSASARALRKIFREKTSARWEAWGRRHGIPVTTIRRRSGR